MNKLIFITGVICILIVAVLFTANTLPEPVKATVEKQQDFKQTYTLQEVFEASQSVCSTEKAETVPKVDENPIEPESVTEAITEPSETGIASYYNVPLPGYLQDVIFAECLLYDIDPAIVIALIEKESTFDQYAMGDDGRSFGLMQIQPKWHLQKMIELGCTNLFDPVQNVMVGMAILGDLKQQYNDIGAALTAYNSGRGGFNAYAKAVIERANEI